MYIYICKTHCSCLQDAATPGAAAPIRSRPARENGNNLKRPQSAYKTTVTNVLAALFWDSSPYCIVRKKIYRKKMRPLFSLLFGALQGAK